MTEMPGWLSPKYVIMEENPSMSYEIVAETVGINDRSNFKKSFEKFKGMTPNEWKRRR